MTREEIEKKLDRLRKRLADVLHDLEELMIERDLIEREADKLLKDIEGLK